MSNYCKVSNILFCMYVLAGLKIGVAVCVDILASLNDHACIYHEESAFI